MTENARDVHRAGALIDLHLDSILWKRLVGYNIRKRHRNRLPRSPYGFHSDLPRMVEGGVTGAYFGLHAWPFTGDRAYKEVIKQIEVFWDLVDNDERLRFGSSADDFEAGHRDGVIVGTMGVEGAHCINGRLERVADLFEAGVRYMTLAHFNRNRAATPAMGAGANEWEGLSDFGRELVKELNRVGMIIDCAHLNEPCRLEAAACSERPVWVTHTGVKGVVDHPRNISDASIDAVVQTGGVIGIMFAPVFMSGKLLGGVSDLIKHVRHIADRVGIDHVAVGTDFDGFIPTVPKEVQDISEMPNFTAALLDAGFTPTEVQKINGGNVLAFLRRHAKSGTEGASSPDGRESENRGNTTGKAVVS